MPKGSSSSSSNIVQKIEKARNLLNDALAILADVNPRPKLALRMPAPATKVNSRALDFSVPMRAFVKKYGAGLSGAKKFTLLVAYLTKGDNSKRVSLAEVEKHWNKMTAKALLGMKFNRLYSSQARDNDWATTEKTGSYHLRPSWKEIFE